MSDIFAKFVSGNVVEQLLASGKLNDFERAFVLQGGCPMSKLSSTDRLQADPMFNLVPQTHCDKIAGTEESIPRGLGSFKLSGTDSFFDDESNREDDTSAISADWERENVSFSSFEEMGAFFEAQKRSNDLEHMSLYELKYRTGSSVPTDQRIIAPSELILKKLEQAQSNAKESVKFHVCSEYMKRKFPELKDKPERCHLCQKVAALGMQMFQATGSRENKQVLNASIMHVDPDKELAVLGNVVSSCKFIQRSAILEEIATIFEREFKVGRILNEIPFKIEWESIQKRISSLQEDVNTIGSIDMSKNASGQSEFSRFQEHLLHRAMNIPTTKVLVEKCIASAKRIYAKAGKELSSKQLQYIERHIQVVAKFYLKRYYLMTNVRWRAPAGKNLYGNIHVHDTPVVCTKCNHQWQCQGAIISPYVHLDYPLNQRKVKATA